MVQGAAMYMQERIEALRRDIDKHGKAKVKKGQQAPPAAKVCTPSPLCFYVPRLCTNIYRVYVPLVFLCTTSMYHVYVPRLCTTCGSMYHVYVPLRTMILTHAMQPVLSSSPRMMDG